MYISEPPTRIYIPQHSDKERLHMLSQSNAPVRIYIPSQAH